MDEAYGKFTEEHLARSKEGFDLFNEQKYWECHEVFEDLWKEDVTDKARYIWWAVIQVAAAMIHYRDNNLIGARGLITKAKNKFDKIDEYNVTTEFVFKYLEWEKLTKMVRSVPDEPELEDFTELYKFRFKDYLNYKGYIDDVHNSNA